MFTWEITYGRGNDHIGPLELSGFSSYILLVSTVVCYLGLVRLIEGLKERLAPWVLPLWSLHNLLLAGFSIAVCTWSFWVLLEEDHFESLHSMACKQIRDRHYEHVSFAFLVSKVWEWMDTVFLVLKGKKVIKLHLIHHASTFWLYAINHSFPSSDKWGVAVNAFIHSFMYVHYYSPFPPQYRIWITRLQIIQFCLSIFLHGMVYMYDCDKRLESRFLEFVTPYILVWIMLALFTNFYVQQYIKKRKSKQL